MSYTENLDDFGYREIDLAIELLTAIKEHGLPKDFEGDGVRLAFNPDWGTVFLTNDYNDVCDVTSDGYLEIYHTLPSGREGFLDDIISDYEDDPEDFSQKDIEYLRDWGADI